MITDEYNSIRSEIHSCIETQNKISFFSLTIFITLTTAAIQFSESSESCGSYTYLELR